MRFALMVAAGLASVAAAEPPKRLDFHGGSLNPPVPMGECPGGVFGLGLTANLDGDGNGVGILALDPNAPTFNEFGERTNGSPLPWRKYECRIRFVKKRVIPGAEGEPLGPRPGWVERLCEVTGPKLTTRLSFVVAHLEDEFPSGRVQILGSDGAVRYGVSVSVPGPFPPCHPGCFPAGTQIGVPGGARAVEALRAGDVVVTVNKNGVASTLKVESIFEVRNALIEVRTEAGNLVTTETQPLALAAGGLREAGALKPGDRIWKRDGVGRRAVSVKQVAATGRTEAVFNLVLGGSELFVAGGFLARSKPPCVEP